MRPRDPAFVSRECVGCGRARRPHLRGAAALELKHEFGVPVVLTAHTGPFSVITRTPAMRCRVRRALLGSDRVVAVSNTLAQMIRGAFPELPLTIDVIPNGVDQRLFRI